jgi:hypothetical protein
VPAACRQAISLCNEGVGHGVFFWQQEAARKVDGWVQARVAGKSHRNKFARIARC